MLKLGREGSVAIEIFLKLEQSNFRTGGESPALRCHYLERCIKGYHTACVIFLPRL